MSKNILLPFSFLRDVWLLVFILEFHYKLDDDTKVLCCSLDAQISEKLAALNRHSVFTKYKSSPPCSLERESFRREYLDKAGFHKDWRADKESLL